MFEHLSSSLQNQCSGRQKICFCVKIFKLKKRNCEKTEPRKKILDMQYDFELLVLELKILAVIVRCSKTRFVYLLISNRWCFHRTENLRKFSKDLKGIDCIHFQSLKIFIYFCLSKLSQI